jgi:TctA family transporter
MDLLHNLGIGLAVACTTQNLLYAFFGAVLGTLIGVLPGIGPVAMIAMLSPLVYRLEATPALIMLAGVYYGAQYGTSTAAILGSVAGGSSSATAAIDGHQMARQGRGGAALSAAALGSFFAGCVGTLIIAALAPPLTELAFSFGPEEYVALMVLGLICAAVLVRGSLVKAIAMILLGLLLAQVGTDPLSHTARYSFDMPALSGGLGLVVIAMGVFVFAEIIANLGEPPGLREVVTTRPKGLWPTRSDFEQAWPSVLRGTALGALLGVLPGGGAWLASFASYVVERRMTRDPRVPFGKGAIQGVAGPESANNASAQTSFIPLLSLGVPANAAMALMVGAMTIKGMPPGPQVMTSNPQVFWGLIGSMWVGNLMLLVLNLPLVGLWTRLLAVPYRLVFPAATLIGCIGIHTLAHRSFDFYLSAVFAVAGYVLHKLGCEPAPLLLGFVLEPMMEENLRRALSLSGGDWGSFVTRPLSSGLLLAAALLIVLVTFPKVRQKRELAFQED